MEFRKTFATFALAAALLALGSGCATGMGDAPGLAGRWALNSDRTAEVQPDNSHRKSRSGSGVHSTVAVGGVPLPMPGSAALPSLPGTARNPRVLQTAGLTIEPSGDQLMLIYDGDQRETLKRGDDQGLVSQWSRDRLTSSYETTSRKVSQVYELQRDGSLLVTVRLAPNQGSTAVYKRVFDRQTDNSAP